MTASPDAPFRFDHVGSLLRPARLQDARARAVEGKCTAAELRAIEDDCIREVVKRQEEVGLDSVTDGEYRRTFFHTDFLQRLGGVTIEEGEFKAAFRKDDGTTVGFKPPTMHITGKITHGEPIQGRDFDFLKAATTHTPKVTIPSPSMLHFRGGRKAIDEAVYPSLDDFYADLSAAYADEIGDLAARGCRYLQMDDTNLAYLCDDGIRESTRARGDDPDELAHTYCRLFNEAIKDRPTDMKVCVHLCRGNFKSAWVAQGGYEPVAQILFNEMNIDGFFLEYDDQRSGDFAPLRFVPKGKRVVLGLMTTKHPALETEDALKRRIDEAAKQVPLDQLCLSPQCGFSSTAHGNDLTEDDQWRKLALLKEVAEEVWG